MTLVANLALERSCILMRVTISFILIVFSVIAGADELTALDSLDMTSSQGWGLLWINQAAH